MRRSVQIVRDSIGRIVSMLTHRSIRVTQHGSRAFVEYDPKVPGRIIRVNIPYLPDDATDDYIAAIQGFLDHEVGHVLHSDSKPLIAGAKLGRRVKNMHNLVEDVYVERKMAQTFPGSGPNIQVLVGYFTARMCRPKIDEALAKGDTKSAQGYAMVPGFRAWAGQLVAQEFCKDPVIEALLKPIADRLGPDIGRELASTKNSQECLDLAIRIVKLLEPEPTPAAEPPSEPPTPPADGDDSTDDPSKGAEDVEREGGEETEGDAPEEGDDADAGGDGDADEGASDPGEEGDDDVATSGDPEEGDGDGDGKGEGDAESGGPEEDSSKTPTAPSESPPEREDLGGTMDEERDFDDSLAELLSQDARVKADNSDYVIFSTDFDQIGAPGDRADQDKVNAMVEAVGKSVGTMQKHLERAIASETKRAWLGGRRRGRISPGALFRTAVGDDRVFRTRYETKAKNTAASLVIDCSGSMSWGNKLGVAARAAYALASTLERIKVACEVSGFTTIEECSALHAAIRAERLATGVSIDYGRTEALYLPIFKGFKERMSPEVTSRIAALTDVTQRKWCNENVDGESIALAAHRLFKQRADRHVMIVLSDGLPSCSGGHGLHGHLKRTVRSIEKAGIDIVGIGIQTEAVSDFYRKSIVLNDIAELPTTVVTQLTRLLLD
jgi:cobaltochelatase CobT